MLVAIAVGNGRGSGPFRMWEAYSEGSPFQPHVFRSVEECREWVRSELAEVTSEGGEE